MNKSKYVRFTLAGEGSYIQPLKDLMTALDGELDNIKSGCVGESVVIELEVIEMTDEEYNALPEFQGW
jgi:hypothetical protein